MSDRVRVSMLGAYLLVMGFLGAAIYSAIRFDHQRAPVLSKLDDAPSRVPAKLMLLEHDVAGSGTVR